MMWRHRQPLSLEVSELFSDLVELYKEPDEYAAEETDSREDEKIAIGHD